MRYRKVPAFFHRIVKIVRSLPRNAGLGGRQSHVTNVGTAGSLVHRDEALYGPACLFLVSTGFSFYHVDAVEFWGTANSLVTHREEADRQRPLRTHQPLTYCHEREDHGISYDD